jgi:hypothetical protein
MQHSPPPPEPRLRELQTQLAEIDFILPGTINIAMNRCGKPNCACHADPPRLRPLHHLDPQGPRQDRHRPTHP